LKRNYLSIFYALLSMVLAGCRTLPTPESYASKSDWMKSVLDYRRQYSEHPGDYEVKMRLEQAELNAAEAFYQDGMSLKEQGLLDDAIYQFREGLTAMPNNEKVANALKSTLKEKEAGTFYQQAVDLDKAGKGDEARNLLNQALAANPDHEGAKALLGKINEESQAKSVGLAVSSKEPISLHFNHTDLRAAFDFIGKTFGINVIFDESAKNKEITLSVENVTFEQALSLILNTTQTFYTQLGPNTILISEDTQAKRGQYEDLMIRTIQLNSVKASDMANILKSTIELKHVIVNEALNTLIIRDTKDVLKLAEEIIAANDRPPAEVLLDVEILEVNRNKEEQLGFNYGSLLTYTGPQTAPNVSTLASTDFLDTLGQGSLTLPTVTFNYFKQDVDSKTLAHPQIRTLDSKEAKIHIGDRVPLTSAVIQQTTGQVQTTYNYTDIGVLLDVSPVINLDRTVSVKLNLEVSSLGANLGTPQNPAFDIGTRDATTNMLLHDGETAILGGLIQDSERKTYVKVPFLGDIPIIGRVFATNSDESSQRTDILLTITPRIVRDWQFPRKDLQEVYSGSSAKLSSKPLFAPFEQKAKGAPAPRIALGEPVGQATPSVTGTPVLPFQGTAPSAPVSGGGVNLSFGEAQYDAVLGQPVTLKLYGENITSLKELPLAVAFNGNFLKFVSATAGSPQVVDVQSDSDEKHGLVRMKLDLKPETQTGPVELVDLVLNGNTPGISYLVFLNPSFKDQNGNDVHAQAHASRIVVK
jgi:general secretion pathway protein D